MRTVDSAPEFNRFAKKFLNITIELIHVNRIHIINPVKQNPGILPLVPDMDRVASRRVAMIIGHNLQIA